jgi:hypothetical protein
MTGRPQALRMNDVCAQRHQHSRLTGFQQKEMKPTLSSSPGQGLPADSLPHSLKNSWNARE